MVKEELEKAHETHRAKINEANNEYRKALEDILERNGFGGDVYNKSGRRGRLLVEKTYGGY